MTLLVLVLPFLVAADMTTNDYAFMDALRNQWSLSGTSFTPAWTGNDNYACDWFGVTCDHSGNLINLTVTAPGLWGGTVPSKLKDTHLVTLSLTGFGLSGAIPTLPGSLTRLTLSSNAFTSASSVIGTGTNLQQVDLSHNQLTGTIASSFFNNKLVSLDLSYNALSGAIPALPSNLQSLSLAVNSFTGAVPTPTTTLRTLNLNNNLLNGTLPTLAATLPLRQLSVAGNGISGPLGSVPASLEVMYVQIIVSFRARFQATDRL